MLEEDQKSKLVAEYFSILRQINEERESAFSEDETLMIARCYVQSLDQVMTEAAETALRTL